MKLTYLILFGLLYSTVSCQDKPVIAKKDYTLVEEDGITVEQFDSTNIDDNRYTQNNDTYTAGTVFTYHFEHSTPTDQKKYFTWSKKEDANGIKSEWHFVAKDSMDETTIKKIQITVKPGLEPMIRYIPDYNQTIIQYKYLTDVGEAPFTGSSGVIENEANVWMHPPRDRYFRILELNPFPFIKAPYEVGNKWSWSLEIGSAWGDARWKTWEGSIENKYTYQITDKKTISTPVGELDCYVIESTATSRIGRTSLTAYFNPTYGFVKLDYRNIDGSRTMLDMVEYLSDNKQ